MSNNKKPDQPREWKFKLLKEPQGFAVIWDMDFCGDNFHPGNFHVIEKSAYDALQKRSDHFEELSRRQFTELAAALAELEGKLK